MPKCKTPKSVVLRGYVEEFGENVFASDGIILNCLVCEKTVSSDTRFQVVQHLSTQLHGKKVEKRSKTNEKQSFLAGSFENQGKLSQFSLDLCLAFTAADIPLYKLENPALRKFLEMYLKTSDPIPHDSTLRKRYLAIAYNNTMKMIQESVAGKKVWISIDETVDVVGRQVASVIVGTLLIEGPGKQFLLTTEVLEKTNHSTIARLFTESLKLLGPDFNPDNILLFLSDGVAYMLKAGRTLTSLYPKMIHVTCLAHGLHRVAETVRSLYQDVDSLISNGKKIFRKCPSRVVDFHREAPGIPLPPRPIPTRWGNL